MLMLLGRVAFVGAKLAVKYVVVPVAVSILVSALADAATRKVNASTARTEAQLAGRPHPAHDGTAYAA